VSEPVTNCRPGYRAARLCSSVYLHALHGMRVEGREHLALEGGLMVVSNHQSFLDIPLLAASTSRHLCFVARDTLARSRPLAWLMRECGAILIKRGSSDRAALREMVEHMRLGDAVVVFPEGTRSPDGELGEFRAGALFAALKAEVPVVPVGIRGAIDAFGRDHRLPRPFRRVSVRFGPAVPVASPEDMPAVRAAVAALVANRPTPGEPPVPAAPAEAADGPEPDPPLPRRGVEARSPRERADTAPPAAGSS